MNNQTHELAKEIISFAKSQGYDIENLTKPMLDKIMKHWINHTKEFNERFSSLPLSSKKSLLGFE